MLSFCFCLRNAKQYRSLLEHGIQVKILIFGCQMILQSRERQMFCILPLCQIRSITLYRQGYEMQQCISQWHLCLCVWQSFYVLLEQHVCAIWIIILVSSSSWLQGVKPKVSHDDGLQTTSSPFATKTTLPCSKSTGGTFSAKNVNNFFLFASTLKVKSSTQR